MTKTTLTLSDKSYNVAKFVAQVLLPAIGTLYFALATIWSLPHPEQVVGTITAVDAFLGILLGVSTKSYNASDARFDGSIDVSPNEEGGKTFLLSLNDQPESIETKQSVVFKVNQ